MKKLLRGLVDFRKTQLPHYREKFAALALGQSPDTLFISCSDSRVAPNWFASTDPGDLFVIRNVGNLIPCCGTDGHSTADESEAAAIEFALLNLKVRDIIVCGHSDCGAMHAILRGRDSVAAPNLRSWLRHGEDALEQLTPEATAMSRVNLLSQHNVLLQLENLKSYPIVRERIENKSLSIHGWWFELSTASIYAFEPNEKRFLLLDEKEADRIMARLNP